LALSVAAVVLPAMQACQDTGAERQTMETQQGLVAGGPREKILIDNDWRFIKGDPEGVSPNQLIYQPRSQGGRGRGNRGGTTQPAAEAPAQPAPPPGIAPWVLPTANALIKDPAQHKQRPEGNLGADVAYTQPNFNDSSWRLLDLPHDFAIEGPFIPPGQAGSDGAMGRLPFFGVAWYRKSLEIPASDAGKQIYLDMDGAMSFSTVWCNGQFVGGWPYGYSSYRLDLTPYLKPGQPNALAIRLDNPPASSRWYPGAGIYRNVWLTKTSPVHVAQWGTYITTPKVQVNGAEKYAAMIQVSVDNKSKETVDAVLETRVYPLDAAGNRGPALPNVAQEAISIPAGGTTTKPPVGITIDDPKLWSPESPNRYVAVTTVKRGDTVLDSYETPFGIRTVTFDPNQGILINGKNYKMNGVCNHHDLGALGTAVNTRALERQLEILREMGCNAIRTSHNPPAPELLELCDRMGFMVMDETFDTWRSTKRPNDYGTVFKDWHEADTRMLVRRDRNHPSVIMWSVGNEIAEQGQGQDGANVAQRLTDIVHEEDPTRPTTAAMNSARPGTPFPTAVDLVGLNYQGSRPSNNAPEGTYPLFKRDFPNKFVFGAETASTISSRGEYTFPVAPGKGAISQGGRGGGTPPGQNVQEHQMSSYDLYYPSWATSPDTEFTAQDRFKFIGGEFVWTGFDYIGEPTPWGGGNDPSRSSYFGIIDLAGFPKDRFYLYQSQWRPDFPMAHILPHWNWPERAGLKNEDGSPAFTPVHVYTSGDEAELFLNGKSLGRKKKEPLTYRIRWDDVVYEPGELRVIAYKDGKEWARNSVKTTNKETALQLKPDRVQIAADGRDLSFVTLSIVDSQGLMVPRTKNMIHFDISGPGEIVATDNGDATDLTSFQSKDRKAFNGLALAIIKAKRGTPGTITVRATAEGLQPATATITTK
jgi:beta-galactosidase